MSIHKPTQSEPALTELFEREARQSHGQYTHIEPEGDDLGTPSATSWSGYSRPADDGDRELMVWDVYEGDSLDDFEPWATHIKATQLGSSCVLSAVDDPTNNQWLQSSVAYDLDECE